MRKGMQKLGMFVMVFLLSFWVSGYALKNWTFLELFLSNGGLKVMGRVQIGVIRVLFSALVGVIPGIYTFLSEVRKVRDESPRLIITFHSVSCVRKNLIHTMDPVLSLGEGPWFVYVQAWLSNTGAEEMRNVAINGQDVEKVVLAPGGKCKIFLRICERNAGNFQGRYKFRVDFKDDRERRFTKKVIFAFDTKERKVREERSTLARRRFLL